ncbi:DUF1311 domain-containing protein [Nostoc sp. FACHB-145]|nr:DUF1311 domain-containing protein [Nostoc sp. FACHB-145]
MKFKIAIFASVILFGTQFGMEPSQALPASHKAGTPLPRPTVILGFGGVLQPDCVRQVEAGEYRCAKRWAEVTHLLKLLVYQDVESQLIPPLQHQLAIADKSWQQFQTQHCQQLTQRLRNTPDFPIAASVCLAQLNNDRIADLKGIAVYDSEDEPQQAPVTSRQDTTQALWERYQTQYCKFESLFFGSQTRSKQCPNRLNLGRLHHIKAMMNTR